MDEVTTLISSVGFPIVMCLLFYYQISNSNNKMEEVLNEIKSIVNEIKILVNK